VITPPLCFVGVVWGLVLASRVSVCLPILLQVSEATKGLEAALSSFKESQEDENGASLCVAPSCSRHLGFMEIAFCGHVRRVVPLPAKLNNRLEETDQQRGKQIEQVQASVEVVREEVGEQLAAAQQELNEALTEQITAVKVSTRCKHRACKCQLSQQHAPQAAVGDLEGTTSELQSTMTAGFKRSDAAREELMASIQQQLQDLSAQLPLTESAQQKEMAEMARELQALKTQVAEDRRERTAEDVRQAELLKRQLEAVQAGMVLCAGFLSQLGGIFRLPSTDVVWCASWCRTSCGSRGV